jgi:hypothetical protein
VGAVFPSGALGRTVPIALLRPAREELRASPALRALEAAPRGLFDARLMPNDQLSPNNDLPLSILPPHDLTSLSVDDRATLDSRLAAAAAAADAPQPAHYPRRSVVFLRGTGCFLAFAPRHSAPSTAEPLFSPISERIAAVTSAEPGAATRPPLELIPNVAVAPLAPTDPHQPLAAAPAHTAAFLPRTDPLAPARILLGPVGPAGARLMLPPPLVTTMPSTGHPPRTAVRTARNQSPSLLPRVPAGSAELGRRHAHSHQAKGVNSCLSPRGASPAVPVTPGAARTHLRPSTTRASATQSAPSFTDTVNSALASHSLLKPEAPIPGTNPSASPWSGLASRSSPASPADTALPRTRSPLTPSTPSSRRQFHHSHLRRSAQSAPSPLSPTATASCPAPASQHPISPATFMGWRAGLGGARPAPVSPATASTLPLRGVELTNFVLDGGECVATYAPASSTAAVPGAGSSELLLLGTHEGEVKICRFN